MATHIFSQDSNFSLKQAVSSTTNLIISGIMLREAYRAFRSGVIYHSQFNTQPPHFKISFILHRPYNPPKKRDSLLFLFTTEKIYALIGGIRCFASLSMTGTRVFLFVIPDIAKYPTIQSLSSMKTVKIKQLLIPPSGTNNPPAAIKTIKSC